MKGKPYVSPTQISLYTKCGEAWRRRYAEKDIIPPGVAALRGTSVHKGAEANFNQKLHTREDLKAAMVQEIVADAFDQTVKHESVWLNPEEESAGKDKTLGSAKDMATRLAGLFATEVAPKYQPTHVEIEHRIELPNCSHDLLGRIDLITDQEVIQDLKSRSKKSSPASVHTDQTLTFYVLAYKNKFGKMPRGLVIDELVDTKIPSVNSVPTQRDENDFEPVVRRINSVLNGLQRGVFTPAKHDAWWCSPTWCGYYRTCPYVPGK